MKPFVVVLGCLVAFSQQQFSGYVPNSNYLARVDPIRDGCLSESSVNPIFVDRLLTAGEFAEDRSLKCFQKCIFVKLNAMNEAGEIEAELQASQIPIPAQVMIDNRIERCRTVRGNDACETAYLVTKCLVEFEEGI